MKTKVFVILSAVLLTLIAAPLSASALDYPVSPLASTTAGPGATVPFSAQTGVPNAVGSVSFSGDSADSGAILTSAISRSTTTNATGGASFSVVLPSNAVAGAVYSVTLTVGSYTSTGFVTIVNIQLDTLALPGDNGSGSGGGFNGQLPTYALGSTGTDVTRYLTFGAVFLFVGGALVALGIVIRRTRRA